MPIVPRPPVERKNLKKPVVGVNNNLAKKDKLAKDKASLRNSATDLSYQDILYKTYP